MTELGPLQLSDESLKGVVYDTTGVPELIYNPYAWTQVTLRLD